MPVFHTYAALFPAI